MKSIGRFAALLVSLVLLVGVPATFEAASAKSGLKLATIKTWSGAQQQACKKSVAKDTKWRVYTRVVNGRQAEVGVGLIVMKGETEVRRASTEIMKKGKTSKVVSVVIPKDTRFTLEAFQFQGQMGTGGPVKLKKIRRC